MRRFTSKSHLRAVIDSRAPAEFKTAANRNSSDRVSTIERITTAIASDSDLSTTVPPNGNAIQRPYNLGTGIGWDCSFLYPAESPLNFSPVRTGSSIHASALDRAVREVPWESKRDLLHRMVRPEFANESVGTPRREFQGGMIDGIRVRALANPYFRPTGQKLKQFDRWKSRHFETWSPLRVAVRGGTRQYDIPTDILPKRNELGEWTSPTLSGRYLADVKRQYVMHGLPWIYERDFQAYKQHILDKEPLGPKRWYKREYRQAKIREAMRNMDSLVEEYRKERQTAKRKTWFEQIVQKLVGSQMASKYISERKLPKL